MSALDSVLNRVPAETRASWVHGGLFGLAWLVGVGFGVVSHIGQNVYPTRIVTHETAAAKVSNASSAAQVSAAFAGSPAQSVTNASYCPVAMKLYSDGKSWRVFVCAP